MHFRMCREKNLFFCLSQRLPAAHAWCHLPSSKVIILNSAFTTTYSSLIPPLLCPFILCDYIGPTQIIQGSISISKSINQSQQQVSFFYLPQQCVHRYWGFRPRHLWQAGGRYHSIYNINIYIGTFCEIGQSKILHLSLVLNKIVSPKFMKCILFLHYLATKSTLNKLYTNPPPKER